MNQWIKGEDPIIETLDFGFTLSIIKDDDGTYSLSILEPNKRVRMEKGFKYYVSAKYFATEWIRNTLWKYNCDVSYSDVKESLDNE